MIAIQPITIVGGGLAGLSLGVALCKAGVPTSILEAGDYPRHRVCGEFITGLDDATIERLEIGSAFAGAGHHRNVTWFRQEQVVGRNVLPSAARTLSRYTLDTRLSELFIAAGGRLSTHTRCASSESAPGWVQTSGRKRIGSSPWIGLKLHARNLVTSGDLEFHLGDSAYVGLSPVENGWINVCGLFRRQPGLRFDRDDAMLAYLRKSGMHVLAERLASAQVRPDSKSAVAGFAFDRRVTKDDGVRLGDACAMIPPFTGNGMAMAFKSAALALNPLITWARGSSLWDETTRCIREALRREFRLRLSSAAVLHPFLIHRTLQSCLGAASRAGLLPMSSLYHLLH